MQCSALRKNGHVVIKGPSALPSRPLAQYAHDRTPSLGRPCKIVDMSTSKTGKHGHAKVHLVAIDVRQICLQRNLCIVDLHLDRSSPAKNWFVNRERADYSPDLIQSIRLQEDISPSTHNMDVPNVVRTEYQLVSHLCT